LRMIISRMATTLFPFSTGVNTAPQASFQHACT
jgi:hypothetical protein